MAGPSTQSLRIMTFNLWRGGIQVDFGQVAAAIRAADPDVVGVQEPEGNTRRLAEMLGWSHVDEGLHLIARYPIFRLAPELDGSRIPRLGTQSIALIERQPGAVVALVNLHLAYSPDGPAELAAGRSDAEMLRVEDARLEEIRPYAERLAALAREGIPAFLIGDFNTPSHLDWTVAAMQRRPEIPRPFRWPVSVLLESAGFRDSFREVHPDPVAVPGLTWSPGCPHPKPYPGIHPDRIDFIMVAGPARTVASRVIGETGGPDVALGLTPWPSDHRAVLSEFAVQPAPPGNVVTVERAAVTQGDPVVIRVLAADLVPGRRVAILGAEDSVVAAMEIGAGSDRRAFALGTALLAPGGFAAAMLDADGKVLARRGFSVLDRAGVPGIEIGNPVLTSGSPIQALWRNAPGHRYDWLGVFRAGEIDPENYLAHHYTGAGIGGVASLQANLAPGDYEIRLMRDDAYVTLAAARFRIR